MFWNSMSNAAANNLEKINEQDIYLPPTDAE